MSRLAERATASFGAALLPAEHGGPRRRSSSSGSSATCGSCRRHRGWACGPGCYQRPPQAISPPAGRCRGLARPTRSGAAPDGFAQPGGRCGPRSDEGDRVARQRRRHLCTGTVRPRPEARRGAPRCDPDHHLLGRQPRPSSPPTRWSSAPAPAARWRPAPWRVRVSTPSCSRRDAGGRSRNSAPPTRSTATPGCTGVPAPPSRWDARRWCCRSAGRSAAPPSSTPAPVTGRRWPFSGAGATSSVSVWPTPTGWQIASTRSNARCGSTPVPLRDHGPQRAPAARCRHDAGLAGGAHPAQRPGL